MENTKKRVASKPPITPAPKKVIETVVTTTNISDKTEDQKPPVDPTDSIANPSDKTDDQKPPVDPTDLTANPSDKSEDQKPPVVPTDTTGKSTGKLEDKKTAKNEAGSDHKKAAIELFERTSYDVVYSNNKGEFFSTENTALLSCKAGEKPVRHERPEAQKK